MLRSNEEVAIVEQAEGGVDGAPAGSATKTASRQTLEERVQMASLEGLQTLHLANSMAYQRHLAAAALATAPRSSATIADLFQVMEKRVVTLKMTQFTTLFNILAHGRPMLVYEQHYHTLKVRMAVILHNIAKEELQRRVKEVRCCVPAVFGKCVP